MTQSQLTERIVELAHELHPNYSHEQCLVWSIAFLADVVIEKNHMDNIVFQRLNARIDQLRQRQQ